MCNRLHLILNFVLISYVILIFRYVMNDIYNSRSSFAQLNIRILHRLNVFTAIKKKQLRL